MPLDNDKKKETHLIDSFIEYLSKLLKAFFIKYVNTVIQ